MPISLTDLRRRQHMARLSGAPVTKALGEDMSDVAAYLGELREKARLILAEEAEAGREEEENPAAQALHARRVDRLRIASDAAGDPDIQHLIETRVRAWLLDAKQHDDPVFRDLARRALELMDATVAKAAMRARMEAAGLFAPPRPLPPPPVTPRPVKALKEKAAELAKYQALAECGIPDVAASARRMIARLQGEGRR
ncbi:MAG: hypothetical protein ACYDAL_14135 [Candidatus Dormibacteraceae bacterium]